MGGVSPTSQKFMLWCTKNFMFGCSHCTCTIFVLTSYSLHTQVKPPSPHCYLENVGHKHAARCIESWFKCNPRNMIFLSNFIFSMLTWADIDCSPTSCQLLPYLLHQKPTPMEGRGPVLPPSLTCLLETLHSKT